MKYDKINHSVNSNFIVKILDEVYVIKKRTQYKDFGLCLKDVVTLVNVLYLQKLSVE